MENRIPYDKTWNAAPADIPQKPRFQPALMSLAREGNLVLIPQGWMRWISRRESFGSPAEVSPEKR